MGLGEYADAGRAWDRQEVDRLERNRLAPPQRRPGRPKGARNRKTVEFEKFFEDCGFTDPLVGMAEFITSDLRGLLAWFREYDKDNAPSLWEIVKEKHAVMAQLAPYLHGKKPTDETEPDERLPMLVLNLGTNQLAQAQEIAGRNAMSIGRPIVEATANENKGLAE